MKGAVQSRKNRTKFVIFLREMLDISLLPQTEGMFTMAASEMWNFEPQKRLWVARQPVPPAWGEKLVQGEPNKLILESKYLLLNLSPSKLKSFVKFELFRLEH